MLKRILVNDKVVVISGSQKGKHATVLSLDFEKGVALVSGLVPVKRHFKAGKKATLPNGGIAELPRRISLSSLMPVSPSGTPSRIRASFLSMPEHEKKKFSKKREFLSTRT